MEKLVKKIFISLFVIFFLFVISTQVVFAQKSIWEGLEECQEQGNCQLNDFLQLGVNLAKIILRYTGVIALVLFIIGGIMWITSGGAPERIQRGKKIITGAIIGIFIIFFATVVIKEIEKAIGVEKEYKIGTDCSELKDGTECGPNMVCYQKRCVTKCEKEFGAQGYRCADRSKGECKEQTIFIGYCPGGAEIVCCQSPAQMPVPGGTPLSCSLPNACVNQAALENGCLKEEGEIKDKGGCPSSETICCLHQCPYQCVENSGDCEMGTILGKGSCYPNWCCKKFQYK